jgi:hypothetical protein
MDGVNTGVITTSTVQLCFGTCSDAVFVFWAPLAQKRSNDACVGMPAPGALQRPATALVRLARDGWYQHGLGLHGRAYHCRCMAGLDPAPFLSFERAEEGNIGGLCRHKVVVFWHALGALLRSAVHAAVGSG